MTTLKIGDKAPDFSVKNELGKDVTLSDFSGKKVVVIDLDMRKPKIHLGFGMKNGKGMSDILIGKSTIEDCVNKSS